MKPILDKIYRYLLFAILFCVVIVLIYFRDIPDKPVIDILIPSISSILAAFVAAFVALRVADYQIAHTEKKELQNKHSKLISRMKLLKKEIAYNEKQIKICMDLLTPDNTPVTAQALAMNLKTELWDILAVEIIEDLNNELFDELIEVYYKISRLKQNGTFDQGFCNKTFAECTAINAKIELLLKNPNLFMNNPSS